MGRSSTLRTWQSGRRGSIDGPRDVNGDGIVDAADYTIIRDHFGHPMGAGQRGQRLGSRRAVPEPSSLILLVGGAVLARQQHAVLLQDLIASRTVDFDD
jgi:hypothetical protein